MRARRSRPTQCRRVRAASASATGTRRSACRPKRRPITFPGWPIAIIVLMKLRFESVNGPVEHDVPRRAAAPVCTRSCPCKRSGPCRPSLSYATSSTLPGSDVVVRSGLDRAGARRQRRVAAVVKRNQANVRIERIGRVKRAQTVDVPIPSRLDTARAPAAALACRSPCGSTSIAAPADASCVATPKYSSIRCSTVCMRSRCPVGTASRFARCANARSPRRKTSPLVQREIKRPTNTRVADSAGHRRGRPQRHKSHTRSRAAQRNRFPQPTHITKLVFVDISLGVNKPGRVRCLVAASVTVLAIAALVVGGMLLRPWGSREWHWALGGAVAVWRCAANRSPHAWAAIAGGASVFAFLAGIAILAEIARSGGVFDASSGSRPSLPPDARAAGSFYWFLPRARWLRRCFQTTRRRWSSPPRSSPLWRPPASIRCPISTRAPSSLTPPRSFFRFRIRRIW